MSISKAQIRKSINNAKKSLLWKFLNIDSIYPLGSFFLISHFGIRRSRQEIDLNLWKIFDDKSNGGTSYGQLTLDNRIMNENLPSLHNSDVYVDYCQYGPHNIPKYEQNSSVYSKDNNNNNNVDDQLIEGKSFFSEEQLLEDDPDDTNDKKKYQKMVLPLTLYGIKPYILKIFDSLFLPDIDYNAKISHYSMMRKSTLSQYNEERYAIFHGNLDEIVKEIQPDPWYKRWRQRAPGITEQLWEARQSLTHEILPGFMQCLSPVFEPTLNCDNYDKIVFKIRTDGRKYVFQLETSYLGQESSYYQALITSPPGEWRVFHIKFEHFIRVLMHKEIHPVLNEEDSGLNKSSIKRMGFRAVGAPGPFRIDIAWIAAVYATNKHI